MQPVTYAARLSPLLILALLALFAVQTLLLAAYLSGALAAPLALAAHATVLAAFICAKGAFADDLTPYFLALLLTGCAGALGAGGILALTLVLARTRVSHHDLEKWYAQISGVREANPAVILHDRIIDGRARRTGRQTSEHFPTLLDGPLAAQQALLGLIGLSYHPDYRVLLKQALRSAEPSIRVHAAAVSVKLRTRARLEFQRLAALDGAADATTLMVRATTLTRLAEGGFLDEADARSAREAALDHCCEALALDPRHPAAADLRCRLLADLQRWREVLAQPAAPRAASDLVDPPVAQSLMHLRRTRELHGLLRQSVLQLRLTPNRELRHAPHG
jgi:hypothetical protein